MGNGSFVDQPTPVRVMGSSAVASLVAGGHHNCVILEVGGVMCWGKNDVGQLGDGTTNNRAFPVSVQGL